MKSDYIGGWLTPHTLTVRNLGIKIFSCFVWFDSTILFWKSISHWGFVLKFFFCMIPQCFFEKALVHATMTTGNPYWRHVLFGSNLIIAQLLLLQRELDLPQKHCTVTSNWFVLKSTFQKSQQSWKIYTYLNKRGPNQLSKDHPSCRLGYRNLED